MPSLTDTQTNNLASTTEVSVGYIEQYAQNSGSTLNQTQALGTQQSVDLQLSPSNIWLASPSQLNLSTDYSLLANLSNQGVLYQPSAELTAKGVTYQSSPTLSVLSASGSLPGLSLNTYQGSTPQGSTQLNYSVNPDGTFQSTGQSITTSSGTNSFNSSSNTPVYLATSDSSAIGTPFFLNSPGGGSSSSSTPTSGQTSTSTSGSTPTSTTSTSTSTPGTTTPSIPGFPGSSISTGSGGSSSSRITQVPSGPGPDPVPVPFELHSTIGLLTISCLIARQAFNRQKVRKLVRAC